MWGYVPANNFSHQKLDADHSGLKTQVSLYFQERLNIEHSYLECIMSSWINKVLSFISIYSCHISKTKSFIFHFNKLVIQTLPNPCHVQIFKVKFDWHLLSNDHTYWFRYWNYLFHHHEFWYLLYLLIAILNGGGPNYNVNYYWFDQIKYMIRPQM